MANTYKKIATVTVGSGGAASIDFSSIPGTYTDLVLKLSARGSGAGAGAGITVKLNGSSSNFNTRYLEGTGSSAISGPDTTWHGAITQSGATASVFGNYEYYLPNYTSSNYKSFSINSVTENNATSAYTDLVAGLWSNTAAVTSISIVPLSGTFDQYSTATLYGIKNS